MKQGRLTVRGACDFELVFGQMGEHFEQTPSQWLYEPFCIISYFAFSKVVLKVWWIIITGVLLEI